MKPLIHLIGGCLILFPAFAFSQKPFREVIETDSSTIEIIRNSVYRCYEETYKHNDSIWWSVRYIDDTTKLHTEGWRTKSGKYLGVWKEYNREGQWMYTWDHDNAICKVNKSLFPYHGMLERMKAKADSLIIATYSKEFFDQYVRFDFIGSAYHGHYQTYSTGTFWIEDYLGSWTQPLKGKPNSYLFRYSVRIAGTDWYEEMIGINLDSVGNYVPSADRFNNYGFEKVIGDKKTFSIDKARAMETAKSHGLVLSDTIQVDEFLFWESLEKEEFYNGYFRYYISEPAGKTEYTKGPERKGIIYRFNVYSFNPWTGDFIEKKKMKIISERGKNSGFTSGLMDDND